MAYRESGNNQTIIPANNRNIDVARQAIQEIAPVQQQKYKAAFAVHGYPCLVYTRARSGNKCSCMGHRKIANSILGEDGKASQGVIAEMLTGERFRTTVYGTERWAANGFKSPQYDPNNPIDPVITPVVSSNGEMPYLEPSMQFEGFDSENVTSPDAKNPFTSSFDVVAEPGTFPNERTHDGVHDIVGDNGPVTVETLDDLMGDWDTGTMSFYEAGCPVCFGTGHVGGYNPLYASRQVFTPDMVYLQEGSIIPGDLPWAANGTFEANIVFPRGASALNSCTLFMGNKRVGYKMFIDQVQANAANIMRFCDGKPHGVRVEMPQDQTWTHFEVQFSVGTTTAMFDFPRQSRSADMNMIDPTEPFQIVISPDVPQALTAGDVIAESVTGKMLMVETVERWNTRNRITLGQTIRVHVIQDREYPFLLPRIHRVPTKDRTTNNQLDNQTGKQLKAGT